MHQIGESPQGEVEARARYDWSSTSPSDAVLEVVADAVGGGPTSFGPLYDHVDPDALNSIFRSSGSDRPTDGTRVSFVLPDRLVVVRGDGEVVVRTRGDAGE